MRRVVLRRFGLDLRRVVRRRVVVLRLPPVFRAAVVLRRVAILFPPDLRRAELRFLLEALERLFAALFLLVDLRRGFRMTTSCSGMSINLSDILPTYKGDDKYD